MVTKSRRDKRSKRSLGDEGDVNGERKELNDNPQNEYINKIIAQLEEKERSLSALNSMWLVHLRNASFIIIIMMLHKFMKSVLEAKENVNVEHSDYVEKVLDIFMLVKNDFSDVIISFFLKGFLVSMAEEKCIVTASPFKHELFFASTALVSVRIFLLFEAGNFTDEVNSEAVMQSLPVFAWYLITTGCLKYMQYSEKCSRKNIQMMKKLRLQREKEY